MDIHHSALKHGVDAVDIDHAVRNAMAVDHLDDDLILYVGPRGDGSLVEVITIVVATMSSWRSTPC